jgi:hypothetical protein
MARRITSGISGRSILGSLTALNNSLQSVVLNTNVVLEPNGTGIVESTAHLQINDGSALRLADDDSSAYVAFKSPATLGASYTLTFPANDGDNTQMLQTNGSGVLTWAAPFVSITDQVADGTVYYPTIITGTSGTTAEVNTSSSKLSFVPSTGRLSVTAITAGSAIISGGSIDGANVGATTAGTGRFTTITETSSIAYKENITPITNALDAILQLVGVTYDRKDGSTKGEAGLIKEEVEKVLPNLVKDDGIHYTKLTAYLIEAVKSLNDEIYQLKGNK